MVRAALAGAPAGKAPPPLLSVVSAVEGSLGARYQDAWESSLPGEAAGPGPGASEAHLGCQCANYLCAAAQCPLATQRAAAAMLHSCRRCRQWCICAS